MRTSHTPKCSACAQVKGTPYGGLGPKRCLADPRGREVGAYVHIDPASGSPLASHIKEPRPAWCPRLTGASL